MSRVAGRLVDRGAITAAYVGIGMAVTIVVSFLLIIPIEPVVWLLALPAGLVIGYYANQRSNRVAGPWSRIVVNGAFAGVATGLTTVLLLLLVKSIFFFADSGYPDFNRVDQDGRAIPPYCESGADCVYNRYLAVDDGARVADLEAAGVTDAASFTSFYWSAQVTPAGLILILSIAGGIGGGLAYGATRPKVRPEEGSVPTSA